MSAKRVLIIALFATVATAGISGTARASDPAVGAILGGVVGAAIGHNINGHNGAVVGGVLGAATGASIAHSSNDRYYEGDRRDRRYYGHPGPTVHGRIVVGEPDYYAPPVVYAPPPRVIYAPPRVVYAPPPVVYRHEYHRDRWHHRRDWDERRHWREHRRWDRHDRHWHDR